MCNMGPMWSLFITLYCPWLHSNEFGTFIYHWCWGKFNPLSSLYFMINHLYVDINSIMKIWDKIKKLLQQNLRRFNSSKVQIFKLRHLVMYLFFISQKAYIHRSHTSVRLSKFGLHMPILEVVKVHWLDYECLSQWAWLQILKHV